VAIVWTRDNQDWKLAAGLTAEQVSAEQERQRKAGFLPADLAGYQAGEGERYATLWVRARPGEQAGLSLRVPEGEQETVQKAFQEKGYLPATLQGTTGADGSVHFAAVWWKGEGPPAGGGAVTWSADRATHAGMVGDCERLLLDVDVGQAAKEAAARRTGPERYTSVWRDDSNREAVGLHGLTAEEHLRRGRALAAQGYRPAALSLAHLPGEGVVAASVWHRPVPSPAEGARHARQRATAAATALHLGLEEEAWPLFQHQPDPTVRSYLVQRAGRLGVDPRLLVRRLEEEKDVSARRALIVALGEYRDKDLPAALRQALVETLLRWYRDDPDPGVHGAIDWLLRHGKEGPSDRKLDWGQAKALEKIDQELRRRDPEGKRGWYVNGQQQTLTRIKGPVEFRMGSPHTEPVRHANERPHRQRIERRFAIAAKPVTVAQFQRFVKERPEVSRNYLQRYSPAADGPILCITFAEAMAYCNWLSASEGIPRAQWCYPDKSAADAKPSPEGLARTGYRLPTEAEWEFACRAGSTVSRYFGSYLELLPRYAFFMGNSREQAWPVGQKRPNDLGLFDMHGNVWQWCQDPCVLRGASFVYLPPDVRAAYRDGPRPTGRNNSIGFRVARTCD
jgi:formylglycine-generating enzyme required for sulfatase activity